MYCRQCGFNNDKYSKMCKRCGSDLTRPTEEYTPSAAEPGQLRFAPKQETVADWFKSRFRRLERAALDRSHLKPFIITAVVVVVVAAALLIIPRVKACLTVVPDTYGDTACNTATHSAAAVNGDYLYCSQPVGDNPGLYRVKLSTGEMLKISWHVLEQTVWYDGWLYGVDETGALIRMSHDGLSEQRVIIERSVSNICIYNGYVYYIGGSGAICRADLSQVSDGQTAQPEVLLDCNACEMIIFEGTIYYIDYVAMGYEPGVPMDSVIDPEYVPGKISWITGREIPPDYRVDAALPELPMGSIYRMTPDGSPIDMGTDASGHSCAVPFITGKLCNLSAHGEYLYYMSQTEEEVQASVFDHGAPGNIIITASSCQFWRFNLVTQKYTRFLDAGTSRSALNVTDDGICFVSLNGDLETCPTVGGDSSLLPTDAVDVESFCVVNDVVYYTSNDGGRVGWINMDGSANVALWQAEWDPVVFPETSDGDAQS